MSACSKCGASGHAAQDHAWGGHLPVVAEEAEVEESPFDPEACPGCGCKPGDGITETCNDLVGCGYWKTLQELYTDEGTERTHVFAAGLVIVR